MQQSDKGQTAHGSDLHLFRGHVWRVGHDKADDRRSGRALRSILALHPETALLTFCTGTLGYFHPVYS
jgi:hypothetical protein